MLSSNWWLLDKHCSNSHSIPTLTKEMFYDVWFLSEKARSGTIKPSALSFVSDGEPLFSLACVNHRVNEACDMSYVICWMWSVKTERAKPHYLHMMECYVTFARTMIMSSSCLLIWFIPHCIWISYLIHRQPCRSVIQFNPGTGWSTLPGEGNITSTLLL